MNKSIELCKRLRLEPLYAYTISTKAYTHKPHSEMWKTMDIENITGKQELKEYILICKHLYPCKNWNIVLNVNTIYIDFTNPNNFIKLLTALGGYCEECFYEFPLFIHKNFIDESLDKILESCKFMEDKFLDKLQLIDFEYEEIRKYDRDYLSNKYKQSLSEKKEV